VVLKLFPEKSQYLQVLWFKLKCSICRKEAQKTQRKRNFVPLPESDY